MASVTPSVGSFCISDSVLSQVSSSGYGASSMHLMCVSPQVSVHIVLAVWWLHVSESCASLILRAGPYGQTKSFGHPHGAAFGSSGYVLHAGTT